MQYLLFESQNRVQCEKFSLVRLCLCVLSQARCVQEWWGSKCPGTVCLETRSTRLHGWSPMEKVRLFDSLFGKQLPLIRGNLMYCSYVIMPALATTFSNSNITNNLEQRQSESRFLISARLCSQLPKWLNGGYMDWTFCCCLMAVMWKYALICPYQVVEARKCKPAGRSAEIASYKPMTFQISLKSCGC